MSIIEQAVAHYTAQERLIILVPEWGTKDKPLEIHVFPMTMAEVNMIQRISKKNASNIEHAANIIVIKARDSMGNRLFKLEDKDALMEKADYRVVARITEEIEARFFGEVETHKRNLRGSPCDTSS
jgi:hypothetical protein